MAMQAIALGYNYPMAARRMGKGFDDEANARLRVAAKRLLEGVYDGHRTKMAAAPSRNPTRTAPPMRRF